MSRLTFREPAEAIAWQKQLRDRYSGERAPAVDLNLKRARVRAISRSAAEQVILKYEWLGTMAQTTRHFGIFFGPYCAGVSCVSVNNSGGNPNAHQEWDIARDELAYLARGANVHWSPTGANSKLIAFTCRFMAAYGAKLLIAYADTDAGEIGTIYQASNWVCVGKGASTRQWVAPNGRVYDQKLPYDRARQKGGTRAQWVKTLKASGWREQLSNPKYRYVYVLDRTDERLARLVESKRRPYPKRASEAGHSPNPG